VLKRATLRVTFPMARPFDFPERWPRPGHGLGEFVAAALGQGRKIEAGAGPAGAPK
jgi:hypothetical protein